MTFCFVIMRDAEGPEAGRKLLEAGGPTRREETMAYTYRN